jgi:hypothetical protein
MEEKKEGLSLVPPIDHTESTIDPPTDQEAKDPITPKEFGGTLLKVMKDFDARISAIEAKVEEHNSMFGDMLQMLGVAAQRDPTVLGKLNWQLMIPKTGGQCGFLPMIVRDLNAIKAKISDKKIVVP